MIRVICDIKEKNMFSIWLRAVRGDKMILKVCVGSACHIKGSYDVINIITKIIEDEGLGEDIELKACFCLNNCTEGVSAVIEGEEYLYSFSKEDVEEKFKEIIREKIL